MTTPFRAKRVRRSFVHHVEAAAARVFDLLCPVREREWVDGWEADVVFSESGGAEDHCVFTTDMPGHGRRTWVVSAHDPGARRIGFTIAHHHFVERLDISVTEEVSDEGPARARLDWTRTYTGTSDEGNALLDQVAGPLLEARMAKLQTELRHFLATGTCLRG